MKEQRKQASECHSAQPDATAAKSRMARPKRLKLEYVIFAHVENPFAPRAQCTKR